jgi:hypothetical protein
MHAAQPVAVFLLGTLLAHAAPLPSLGCIVEDAAEADIRCVVVPIQHCQESFVGAERVKETILGKKSVQATLL